MRIDLMKVLAGSGLVVITAVACSDNAPKGPVTATPASAQATTGTLGYFEGNVDPARGTMSILVHSADGRIQTQSTLPWSTTSGVYMHTCGVPTYGSHLLSGNVQAVNLMSGSVAGVSAVIDSISATGVTLASGAGAGSTAGIIATYGAVPVNTNNCASTTAWAFSDPSDTAFSFIGHVDGEAPWTVSSNLVAAYDARVLSSLTRSGASVSGWADLSGNGHNLAANGGSPTYNATLINGQPGLNFTGAVGTGSCPSCAGMISASFANSTQVTVFAVVTWNPAGIVPDWANVAFHINRDQYWSLEQDGTCCGGGTNVSHFQSCNDNGGNNVTLTPNTTYILEGRIDASNNRTYNVISTAGGTVSQSMTNSNCISLGSGPLYVGKSDSNEAFNGYYGELLYYNTNLSDAQVSSVITSLRSSWGI